MATLLTVRISQDSHRALRELSERLGEPMPSVLASAIEEYRRKLFLEGLNEDFAAPPEYAAESVGEREG